LARPKDIKVYALSKKGSPSAAITNNYERIIKYFKVPGTVNIFDSDDTDISSWKSSILYVPIGMNFESGDAFHRRNKRRD